jgi:carbamoyltransferase
MIVLGINGGTAFENDEYPIGFMNHDAAAVLMKDGEVLAAIEEERLSRIKHSNCFPVNAIRWCLENAGCEWSSIDRVATNMSAATADTQELSEFWWDPNRVPLSNGSARLNRLFMRAFGVDVQDRLRFCPHHLAHAWSTYLPSGFDRSLILSLDGDGDDTSGMVLVGRGTDIKKIRDYEINQSLGHFYSQFIRLMGYSRFDEYKVMGLAPYGDPSRYSALMAKLYRLLPEGDYRIAGPTELMSRLHAAGLFAHARRKGEPFSPICMDLAAALQATLEKIVIHIARHFRTATSETNLCLAGGVAHNCTMNGKLLGSGLFDSVFVQPAAHDAGGALGAAWWATWSEKAGLARPRLQHLYFGTDVDKEESVRAELEKWKEFVDYQEVPDVGIHAAQLLAKGEIIGWAQGRSEFGPRALGSRSILADARPAANKEIINDIVKKREAYRPFAPAVLRENASEYFDIPGRQNELPFMIFVVGVKEHARNLLGAVTHVDGTARVQTVSKESNPLFWKLISEFGRITGVPVVLNTSFNCNAEPIVDTANDAVCCFLTTQLKYLVIDRFIVTKRELGAGKPACLNLSLDLAGYRKLVRKKVFGADKYSFHIESVKSRFFGPRDVPISENLFKILLRSDGRKSIASILSELGGADEKTVAEIRDEVLDLWARRIVIVQPQSAKQLSHEPEDSEKPALRTAENIEAEANIESVYSPV